MYNDKHRACKQGKSDAYAEVTIEYYEYDSEDDRGAFDAYTVSYNESNSHPGPSMFSAITH